MSAPNYRWIILLLCTYVSVCYAVVFQSIPPILHALIRDLGVSYAQAVALMGSFALPAIAVALPSGYLLDRFGVQRAGTLALIMFALGAGVVAVADAYSMYIAGRIICGVGAAAILIYSPSAIAKWFEAQETGFAMGIYSTAIPFGTIIALMSLGVVSEAVGWNTVLSGVTAVAVSALVLFFVLYRDAERRTMDSEYVATTDLTSICKDAGFTIWILALIWMLYSAGHMQYYTFATEYFIAGGASVDQAGLYASGPMWVALLATPVFGLLLDKFGHAWLFILSGTLGISVANALIPAGTPFLLPAILLIGVSSSALAVTVMALPPTVMPIHTIGFSYAVLSTSMGIGMFIGGILLGHLRDITGNGSAVFYGISVLTLVCIVPSVTLRGR